MEQENIQLLFSLLRSAIAGIRLTEEERNRISPELLDELLKISSKHEVAHLLVLGLKKNDLITTSDVMFKQYILKTVYKYERMQKEYENLKEALEKAEIPFLPLKGSVIRKYYPESWMRTSCDIDVLVHAEKLDIAISYLMKKLQYVEKDRSTHDISLVSPTGIVVELHFDLVEEERANKAIDVLRLVWDNVVLCENCKYMYEMKDSFFYFYHVAHMAKHFENGGCGIRPFIDLWILENLKNRNQNACDELLLQGDLLRFAEVSRHLSDVWFGNGKPNEITLQMQDFILKGGAYGASDNRVAIQQKKRGGRIGYFISRMIIPYERLKRYYPVLEKHRWMMPFYQIKRWFMLLDPNIAKMAKNEININRKLEKTRADEMNIFLDNIGLK